MKERLLREWPREGQLSEDVPTSSKEMLLILTGKLIEENKALFDYEREMGYLGPGSIQTVHLIVRPPAPQKASKKDIKPTCCCIV